MLAAAVVFILVLAGVAVGAFVLAGVFFAIGLALRWDLVPPKRATSPDLTSKSEQRFHWLKGKTGDIARFEPADGGVEP